MPDHNPWCFNGGANDVGWGSSVCAYNICWRLQNFHDTLSCSHIWIIIFCSFMCYQFFSSFLFFYFGRCQNHFSRWLIQSPACLKGVNSMLLCCAIEAKSMLNECQDTQPLKQVHYGPRFGSARFGSVRLGESNALGPPLRCFIYYARSKKNANRVIPVVI